MKKLFAILLAVVMVMSLALVASADTSYTAKLGYANSDWSAQEWGENVNTTVTGAGDYSVSWDAAASDALVFVIDIVGAGADFQAAGLELTALSVTVDGTEVPVDLSKVVTGDIEENGNWRIEIYNEYGSTKDNAPVDPAAVTFASNLTVNFTLTDPNAPVETEPATTAPVETEPATTAPVSDSTNAKTGDSVSVFAALLAVSAMGIAVISKKKEF